MTNEQKRINIDLAARLDKDSTKRVEQGINDLIAKAEDNPIHVKFDISQAVRGLNEVFKQLQLVNKSISSSELQILKYNAQFRQLGQDMKFGETVQDNLFNVLTTLGKINGILASVQDKKYGNDIGVNVQGFHTFLQLVTGAETATKKFGESLKTAGATGGILGLLNSINSSLDEIVKKLQIEKLRPLETVTRQINEQQEAFNKADSALTAYRQSLLQTFSGEATEDAERLKNQIKELNDYFDTGSASKMAGKALSGDFAASDVSAKFVKNLSAALALTDEQLEQITFKVGNATHSLLELKNVGAIESINSSINESLIEFDKISAKIEELQEKRNNALAAKDDKLANSYKTQINDLKLQLGDITKTADVQPLLKLRAALGGETITNINRSTQALAELNAEKDKINDYNSSGLNINQSSLNQLKEAIQSIGSLTANLGEGTTIGFTQEQIDQVTSSFEGLKNIIQQIYDLLNGVGEGGQFKAVMDSIASMSSSIEGLQGRKIGINPSDIEPVVNSLNDLKTVLIDIQTAINNFDFFKLGKKLSPSQIEQLTDSLKEADKAAEETKRHTEELSTVIVPQGFWSNADKQIEEQQRLQEETRKSKEEAERVIESYNKFQNVQAVNRATEALRVHETELQKIARLAFQQDTGIGVNTFDQLTRSGTAESLHRIAEESELAAQRVRELAEAEREAQQIQLQDYAKRAFQQDVGVGNNQFNQITKAGVAESLERISRAYEESTRKAIEFENATQSANATVAWIEGLEQELISAGDQAQVASQKMNELSASIQNADAGYGFEPVDQAIEQIIQELDKAEQALIEFYNSGNGDSKELDKYIAKVKKAQSAYNSYVGTKRKSDKEVKAIMAARVSELEREQKASAQAAQKVENDNIKRVQAIQKAIDKYDEYVTKMESSGDAQHVGEQFKGFTKELDELRSKVDSFKTNGFTVGGIEEAEGKVKSLKIETIQMNEAVKQAKKSMDTLAAQSKIDSLVHRMDSFVTVNQGLSTVTKQTIEGLRQETQATGLMDSQLQDITKRFNDATLAAQKNHETGITWGEGWKKRLASLTQYLATFVSFYRIVGYVRESFSTIKELDTALVDLRKTAHMSTEEFERFYFDSNNIAKQMGVTTKAIIEQASSWSRLGYNTAETASQMAALSSQFASISPGMSTDTAQSGLVSIMKAYDVEVEDVKRSIIDNINTLGNSFAESNEDIVQGLERSAAALHATGTTLEESLALFTGGKILYLNVQKCA